MYDSPPVLPPANYGVFFGSMPRHGSVPQQARPALSDEELLGQAVGALPLPDGAGQRSTPGAATAAWLRMRGSPHTRRAYFRDLAHYLSWLKTRDLDPREVRRDDVDLYVAQLVMGSRPVATATVNRRLSALSSWYTCLADHDLVVGNPIAAVDRPPLNRDFSPTVDLTVADVRALLSAADAAVDMWNQHSPRRFVAARNRLLVGLLAGLGLRVSEAIGLDLADLRHNAGSRTLLIRSAGGRNRELPVPARLALQLDVQMRHQQLGFATAEVKNNADRIFRQFHADARYNPKGGMTRAGVREWERLLARRDAEYARLRALPPEAWMRQPASGLLFTTNVGRSLTQGKVFDIVRRLARAAGLPAAEKISPHSLRHAAATAALEHGATLREVQDFLGYAERRTTRRDDRNCGSLDRSPAHRLGVLYAE